MALYSNSSFQKMAWPLGIYYYYLTVTTNAFGFHATVSSRSLKTIPRQQLPLPFNSNRASFQSSVLKRLYLTKGNDNNDFNKESLYQGSSTFTIDPNSNEANDLMNTLGIKDETQQSQLKSFARLVVWWNERLNLISRKDCTVDVVFGRHILPSIALAALPEFMEKDESDNNTNEPCRVVDIGTGGGFPGIPLAIIYPNMEFCLVDSVGKKLKAIEEMVEELGLRNVRTYNGRAEEMVDHSTTHQGAYDLCVGRSVAPLPKFCFWIQGLLKKEGKLVYVIGGDVESIILSRAKSNIPIDSLVGQKGISDKRTMIFDSSDVITIAAESGEKKQKKGTPKVKGNSRSKNKSKGSWEKRDNSMKKQRGYEDLKRYSINSNLNTSD